MRAMIAASRKFLGALTRPLASSLAHLLRSLTRLVKDLGVLRLMALWFLLNLALLVLLLLPPSWLPGHPAYLPFLPHLPLK